MTIYHEPTSLEAALSLLARNPDLMPLAGATDYYPQHLAGAAWGTSSVAPPLLDLSGIEGLRGIEDRDDHWWIGAMTTWTDIIRATLPPLFDGLKAAAREIGGVQIQNRATIGGNICTASPAGDSIPCLLALDAEIACVGGVEFRVPLSAFITGYRKTVLDGELVTGIRIPKQSGNGHFLKLGARRHLVISIAMASSVLDIDTTTRVIRSAAIAVGACSAVALRLPRLEARLIGTRYGDIKSEPEDFGHLAPIDDVRASADYRRAAAIQLVADLLAHYGTVQRRPT